MNTIRNKPRLNFPHDIEERARFYGQMKSKAMAGIEVTGIDKYSFGFQREMFIYYRDLMLAILRKDPIQLEAFDIRELAA